LRIAGCLSCLVVLAAAVAGAANPPAPKRILLLNQIGGPGPFRGRFDIAFFDALQSNAVAPVELYEETVETERFSGVDQSHLMRDYLKYKYAGRRIDVIVAQGVVPLAFARQNRELFGNPPIVAIASPAGLVGGSHDNVTGLQGGFWISGTMDLALALRPDTRTVFVVDGARENIDELQAEVERQLRQRHPGLDVVYLRDLPLSDVVARIASVPEQSVVLFIKQTMLTRLHDVDQDDALGQIVSASHVPVFSQREDFIGRGIIGGYVWRFEDDARQMAEMARQIANGASARDIPVGRATYSGLLDWRQLERWHIPASRVPAGTTVLFRPQSFFELYQQYVVGGLLIFAAQLALIVGLLVHRRRRHRAEEASRNSEARYRSVVDTQSELICRFLPDSTLTFVNDAYCRFWNKTREDLLGTRFVELIPPGAREAVLERIGRLSSGTDSHDHQVTLPDGSIGWHHWINHAITDDRGRLIELQGVGRDITARKRAEEALSRAEARNSAMLRAIPDLMFVLSRDGTYVDYHAKDPKLLFVPPEVFIGKTIHDVMPRHLVDMFMDALERAFQGEEAIVGYELAMGETRYFEARLVRAGDDRVLSMVRDVTDGRRAAELNRDLAGRLIASQEVERARIARELHDDLSQRFALLTIGIDRLASTVDVEGEKFRELSRSAREIALDIHQLSHELHPSKLQTLGLVAAIQSLCRDVTRQGAVQVVFTHGVLPDAVDPNVSLCLYRIAQEALHNVARHSHAQEAQVRLSRDGDHLVLQIADPGVGFDPHDSRQGGLGLISMRERVAFLSGQLAIHASPGEGTRIVVRVPASPPTREVGVALCDRVALPDQV
jgi:PAS domain S-box-containing protein